jgi:hypothetical protein
VEPVLGRCRGQEMGKFQFVANVQSLLQFLASRADLPSQGLKLFLLEQACPCRDNGSYVSYSFGWGRSQPESHFHILQKAAVHRDRPTIEGSSHHNECVYVYRFHSLCEIWCDCRRSVRGRRITFKSQHTSGEEVHHQGQPFQRGG